MSKLFLTRELIVPAVRRPMTLARKRRIHTMREGTCCDCGTPDQPITGPTVIYHHAPPLGLLEKDVDERVYLRCISCDQAGTPQDISQVAKAKRQAKMLAPIEEKKGRRWPKGRKLQGAGFNKNLRKRMDGRVEHRG